MKVNSNYCDLYSVIYELTKRTEQDVREFEIAINDNDLKKKGLLNIGTAYMNSIIISLSKLFNITRSDKTGLEQLKTISPKKLQSQIMEIKSDYSNIVKKLSCNRNRIIAHIDISKKNAYHNMGISEAECERVISDYKNSSHYENPNDLFIAEMRKIQTIDKNNERYCLSDFQKDIPILKEILKKIKIINDGIFEYYFNQKSNPN